MRKMNLVCICICLFAFLSGCQNTAISQDSFIADLNFDTQIKLYDGEFIVENNPRDIDFSAWGNVKSVSSGIFYLGGIRNDGTVIITDYNGNDLDVSGWEDISMVEFTLFSAYGLCEDGTIVSTTAGTEYENSLDTEVLSWSDIVYIDTGCFGIVGLKKDGEVIAAVDLVDDSEEKWIEKKVSEWTDIKMISISAIGDRARIIGLKSNGEIVEVRSRQLLEYNLDPYEELNGAVKICAGNSFTAGLMTDGTLRVICGNDYRERIEHRQEGVTYLDIQKLDGTENVLDVNSYDDSIVVLKKDGTVLLGGVFSIG